MSEREFWPTPRAGDGMSHPLRKPANIKGNGRGRLEDVVALRSAASLPASAGSTSASNGPVRSLGNAVVPQVVEVLGRRLMDAMP